jgi:prepilin-type N-terminal cleavage/methylation domain-containing protein
MRISDLKARRSRRGVTLIELLTVIAIIAILVAILFPVFATVREQTRKSGCMNNIKDIIQALKVYKDDWRVYPDALYGIQYANPPGSVFETRLWPEYVKDRNNFVCPNSWVKAPPSDVAADVIAPAQKSAGVNTAALPRPYGVMRWSSYDVQYLPNNAGGAPELHYTTKWSTGVAGVLDEKRQLVYKDPPDTTVVTWCAYHADKDAAGLPKPQGMIIAGFLSGRVQTIPASQFPGWTQTTGPWTVMPKP